jgi:heme-degrading monooxygenase HmoA
VDTRDPAAALTVVNRLVVRGDHTVFEAACDAHAAFLLSRPHFGHLVVLRTATQPRVYTQFAHWERLDGFLDTVREPAFRAHVERIGPLVEASADQMDSVFRVLRYAATEGGLNVLITWARLLCEDQRYAFEARFAALSEHCAATEGFGGCDLLFSSVNPLNYAILQWWREAEDCERALCGTGYRRLRLSLAGLAMLRTERVVHVRYGDPTQPLSAR